MECEMLMFAVDDERFLNLYGDKAARLSTTQSVHFSEHRRKKIGDPAPPLAENATQEPWYRRISKAVLPWTWQRRSEDDGPSDANHVDATPPVDTEARDMQRNSPLLNIFSLFMFGGPGIHMKRLRELTVDRIVRKHGFEKYVEKMVGEWRDITLYVSRRFRSSVATYLLTLQPGHRHLISERVFPDYPECGRSWECRSQSDKFPESQLFFDPC
jgi:hypothetical protein